MPWTILLKFFSNPKVIIAIVIAIVLGGAYYKYHSLVSDLQETEAALKQEKDNNVVLRDNVDTLTQINTANSRILQQQATSAKTTVETIAKLSNELKKSGQIFVDTQTRIEAIKETPVPLTSYFKEAINGIQSARININPVPLPATPASAPKEDLVK